MQKAYNVPKEPSAFGLYGTLSGPFIGEQSGIQSSKHRQARDWESGAHIDGPSDVGRRGKNKEKEEDNAIGR